MLKKILLASALLIPQFLFAAIDITGEESVVAFDQSKSDSNTIWNNWFISVGAGAQLMNEEPAPVVHEETTSRIGSSLSDWVTPNSGVRIMHSGLSLKGARRNYMFSKMYAKDSSINNNGFNPMNLHADILYNGSNLIFGYDEKREWKVIPYRTNHSQPVHEKFFSQQINQEIEKSNVPINIRLDIRGTFLGNEPSYNSSNSVSATLGFLYNLPNRGWKNVQIPIQNSLQWKEHCNHMIYLNNQ